MDQTEQWKILHREEVLDLSIEMWRRAIENFEARRAWRLQQVMERNRPQPLLPPPPED